MIPASQGTPNSYFFQPNAIRGTRAQINSVQYDDLRNGNLVAASAAIRPGRACAFAAGSTGGNSYQPILNITAIVPAFVAADFAGIISGDIWQERIGQISNAIDADNTTVTAQPGDLIPRAVSGEWWVEVDALAGINRGVVAQVLTAAGVNQGAFSAAGGTALTGVLVFTGRTATVGGLPFAVVKFVNELVA
jgi:hypothetical protein